MKMALVLSYTPESYETLPTLKTAHKNFTEKSARDVLDGEILHLFDEYPDARQKFGLQLLRKHHYYPSTAPSFSCLGMFQDATVQTA